MLGQTNQLLGGRKDVGLLLGKVRAETRLPSSVPGVACQDSSLHPGIWEALVRREVDKENPSMQMPSVKSSCLFTISNVHASM